MKSLSFWERTDGRAALTLSIAAIVLGLVGALAAFVLYWAIMLFTNLSFYQQAVFMIRYPPDRLAPWMLFLPAAGGLVIGLLAYFGTDRIRGHGIPEAMEAVIVRKSRVSVKVAIFKPISAAIAVGTGGPFGAEGPIIQTGGAIGSLIGQVLHLTTEERKVFLACGAVAGMVGIFNTPIAAVALALELLLFEFRARSLLPIIMASAVAGAARMYLLGSEIMFSVELGDYGGPSVLPLIVPLGIIIGVAAVLVSKWLFWVEKLFEDVLHLHMIVAPAVGGLLLGVIAYFEPRVLGMGYMTITQLLQGQLPAGDALGLALGKAGALLVTLGSGTSGGLLAPMLLIGSAIGSAYGQTMALLFPGLSLDPTVCAIVAMSAFFGAAARIPLTSFLFAFELTGDYNAILPLMIGCIVADISARLLTEHSVMTDRLAMRGVAAPQTYEADTLTYSRVGGLMRSDFRAVPPETPLRQLLAELQQADERVVKSTERIGLRRRHHWWLVERPDGRFAGIVTRRQILAAQSDPSLIDRAASEFAKKALAIAHPDELMRDALARMLQNDLPWLPVVDRLDPEKLLGYVSYNDALAALHSRLDDEKIREGVLGAAVTRLAARLGAVADRSPSSG